MDDLQYFKEEQKWKKKLKGFKPCYIWMTFNTKNRSIRWEAKNSFKPCYIWMTFNT